MSFKSRFSNSSVFNWDDGFVFTSPVGSFKPNPWGLYDMTGNAWEWCSDFRGDYPNGEATDPRGPDNGNTHVLRGGAWNEYPGHCRCACRVGAPDVRTDSFGFRVVLDSE
jgi:formylglycine-generating enzyme required for sulfatase activity